MGQTGLESLTAVFDAALGRLRRHIPPRSVQAYAFALFCTCGATLFEIWLLWLDPKASPLSGYYPAVALTALLAGIAPGALVAIAGVLIAWWGFMAPVYSFSLERHGDVITLITFAILSFLIVCAADYFRRLAKRLEDEEHLRQLAVQELAHRLKNKIATIQAIISVQLRDQPQVRTDILARLQALTATDQLIEDANGRGAFTRDIAETELGPYVASRVSIDGPNVLLPPKYALTIALLLHELATNSAKYGSLSMPDGRVVLRSSMSDDVLRIEWQESGGPPVISPTTRGFGLRLLSRALEQFGGGTEMLFEPSGLVCRMNLKLPADVKPDPLGDDGDQTISAVTTQPATQ
jgi:two-component sensor histidine kinase